MANTFDYQFNVGGNFTIQMDGMNTVLGEFTAKAQAAENKSRSLVNSLAGFSYYLQN